MEWQLVPGEDTVPDRRTWSEDDYVLAMTALAEVVKTRDPNAKLALVPRLKREREEEDDTLCVVCLERLADTLVLPCGHQVCCRACSDRLRTTANAALCVLCRRPLTEVLADEPGAAALQPPEKKTRT